MVHVLYNGGANNGHAFEDVKNLMEVVNDEITYVDTSTMDDYLEYVEGLDAGDRIIVAGGDGTLHFLVNHIPEEQLKRLKLDYIPAGTGNDFAHELGYERGEIIEDFTKYLINLPTARINGKEYKFINGVGFGIDGYCCETAMEIAKKSTKPINYTSIALKGVLYKFKPLTAAVTIDGNTNVYKHVWLAPIMNGKCFGGGMMPTPKQERLGKDRKLSVMLLKTPGRLHILWAFPTIFKGKHVKYRHMVKIHRGKDISVSVNRPCPCQIDGDTIRNVSKIEVFFD